MAVPAEGSDAIGHFLGRLGERAGLGDLAADMAMKTDCPDVGELRRRPVLLARPGDVDSELTFFHPCGDIGMGFRVNVGVHPHRDRGRLPGPAGHPVDVSKFVLALDVEHEYALLERIGDLIVRLSHPGEDDLLGRHPRLDPPEELSPRNDVESSAEFREKPQDGEIRIALHREANQMRNPRERLVERAEMPYQRLVAIDIKRGAHLLGEPGHSHPLGVEHTVFVLKLVHVFLSTPNGNKS